MPPKVDYREILKKTESKFIDEILNIRGISIKFLKEKPSNRSLTSNTICIFDSSIVSICISIKKRMSPYLRSEEKEKKEKEKEERLNKFMAILSKLSHFHNLQFLRLARCHLRSIPSSIFQINSLKYLDLKFNEIKQLPSKIEFLKNLEILDLSRNKIKNLPQTIGNLPNLKELNLYKNNLTEIPNEIRYLQNLIILNLAQNHIKKLPLELSAMENLEELNFWHNDITELPESIGNLTNLKNLNLRYNHLQYLPKSFRNLKNLINLEVHNNNWISLAPLPENLLLNGSLKINKDSMKNFPQFHCFKYFNSGGRYDPGYFYSTPEKIRLEIEQYDNENHEKNRLNSRDELASRYRHFYRNYPFFYYFKEHIDEIIDRFVKKKVILTDIELKRATMEMKYNLFMKIKKMKVSTKEKKIEAQRKIILSLYRTKKIDPKQLEIILKINQNLTHALSILNVPVNDRNVFSVRAENVIMLCIVESNQLHEFPEEICDLHYLEKLIIKNQGITKISPKIIKLKNLKLVNLSYNQIYSFPKEILSFKEHVKVTLNDFLNYDQNHIINSVIERDEEYISYELFSNSILSFHEIITSLIFMYVKSRKLSENEIPYPFSEIELKLIVKFASSDDLNFLFANLQNDDPILRQIYRRLTIKTAKNNEIIL
ncbi:leucine-rich repeat domain-containing protein [Candidatus Harpocratesius sp.]